MNTKVKPMPLPSIPKLPKAGGNQEAAINHSITNIL